MSDIADSNSDCTSLNESSDDEVNTSSHETIKNTDGRLTSPWGRASNRKSALKPNITCRLRSFKHHYPLELEPSFKYTLPANGFDVHFHEFRGLGPPPADIGCPGDVYIDTTEGSLALHVAMQRRKWKRWTGHIVEFSGARGGRHTFGFDHPLVRDRTLWCTSKSVVWYAHNTLRSSPSFTGRDTQASCFLSRILHGDADQPAQLGKRARDDDSEDEEDQERTLVDINLLGENKRIDARIDMTGACNNFLFEGNGYKAHQCSERTTWPRCVIHAILISCQSFQLS